jgi:hypothetical protein
MPHSRCTHRDLPEGPALDEALEAAELDDVQPRLLHLVLVVQQDRHLAVPLDAGHRLDRDDALQEPFVVSNLAEIIPGARPAGPRIFQFLSRT